MKPEEMLKIMLGGIKAVSDHMDKNVIKEKLQELINTI
jgi:hypothetical protein